MRHVIPPPPFFLEACAAVLPALALAATLALPVGAQHIPQSAIDNSRVLDSNVFYVTSLTNNLVWQAPTVQGRTWTGLVQNLQIEPLPGPAGSTTFGVGSNSHCAHTPGVSGGVEFHNPTGTYSRGQPIAIACPTWTTRKCSRSVTFMGRTFTANKGYPRCTGPTETLTVDGYTGSTPTQQTDPGTFTPIAKTPSRGTFRVRVWGNVCLGGGSPCYSLKDEGNRRWPANSSSAIHQFGYGATFQPARHCGPARWPSEAWRQQGGPGYAEYCDVTVDVRFP